MKMILEYPESLPDLLQETPGEFEKEMRCALAAKLYEMKRIPSGTAAKIAGMSRKDFLLQLSKFGVPATDLEKEELESDIDNVRT